MPRPYDLGVLFVHGIGQQRRGETLIRFGEPLARGVQDRFTRGAPAHTLQPEQPGVVEFGRAILDDEGTPPHAEVTLKNVQAFRHTARPTADTRWLFAEAWWAELFPTPTFGEIARWSYDILPWTLVGHFDTRLRRAWFRFSEAPTWEEQAVAALGWIRQILYLSLIVFATPLIVALLFAILAIAALPVPYARDLAGWMQRMLAATIGDSYVLVGWPIARAAILARVARDFAWLSDRCERVVIVAHSQGGAIAHEFLRHEPLAPCDAFVTFGSGLRKLSELRDAIDSAGRGWLRLLSLTGPVVAALMVAALLLPEPWLWLAVAGVVLAVAASRLALVRWRRVNNRSVIHREQWVADRQQYHRRYRLPHPHRVRWMDGFASADPVPNGPLFDELLPDEMSTRTFANYHSMLADHTAYWRNMDDFVARLGWELLHQSDISADGIDPDDGARQTVATRRRQCRVGWLRAGRWLAASAGLVAMAAWWNEGPGWLARAVRFTASGLGSVPWAGPFLARHDQNGVGHVPGILTIVAGALLWLVLLRLSWHGWNARDMRRRFSREPYRLGDLRFGLYAGILVLGSALVFWVTWATGDARIPEMVAFGVLGFGVVLAATEVTGVTEVLKEWRATFAYGPVQAADARLGERYQRRLIRGSRRGRGWAACELGGVLEGSNPTEAVAQYERALQLGFGKAAWQLGLHFEECDPARAMHYFALGAKQGDPDCAWFRGRLQEKTGDVAGALQTFREGLEKQRSPQCGHNLGHLLQPTDPIGARAAYEQGIALGDPLSAEFLGRMLLLEARAFPPPPSDRRQALLLESAAYLRKALQLGAADAAVFLGDALRESGDIAGALQSYKAGVALRLPQAAFELGTLSVTERDYDEACRAFERCIDLADGLPLGATAAYELGRLLDTLERPAAAERSYRRALQRGSADAAVRLGELTAARGDHDEAESAYRQGMALGSAKAAVELGRFHTEQRFDSRRAGEAYRQAWLIERRDMPEAWMALLERHGDVQGARAALATEKGFIGGRNLYRLGRVLEHRGDLEGAAQAYGRAEDSVEAMFALGQLMERLERRSDAKSAFERAMALGSGEAAYRVGLLKQSAGDHGGAAEAFEVARRRGHPRAAGA